MNINDFTPIVISSTVVYLFLVLAIRLFGKKEIAQLSVIDLVFILLISNAVQNAMVGGNSTLLGGLVAASTLFVINFILKRLLFWSPKLNQLLQGSPIMLVYNGKIDKDHLVKTGISMEELQAAIREHGVESVEEVDLAVLEADGNISILSEQFRKQSTKKRRSHKVVSKNV